MTLSVESGNDCYDESGEFWYWILIGFSYLNSLTGSTDFAGFRLC